MEPIAWNGGSYYQNMAYNNGYDLRDADIMSGYMNSTYTTPVMPMGGYYGYNNYGAYQQQYYDQMQQNIYYQRNFDMQFSAPDELIHAKAATLNEKINMSEQEQIQDAYNELKRVVSEKYPSATPEMIGARTATLYQQIYGKTITDHIREKGSCSFVQGLKQVLSFGLADKITAEENIAQITNSQVSRSDKAYKTLGHAAGGAAWGAAIGTCIAPGVGTLIGAGIGAVAGGILGGLFSKK